MKVLVDTSVWSNALRKKNKGRSEKDLRVFTSLIQDGRVVLIGPVLQELLSGIKSFSQFETLKSKLSFFNFEDILREDYVQAAKCFNACRSKGIQGSHIDFLIVAVSIRLKIPIYTFDKDFYSYSEHISFQLFKDAEG